MKQQRARRSLGALNQSARSPIRGLTKKDAKTAMPVAAPVSGAVRPILFKYTVWKGIAAPTAGNEI